MNPGRARLDFGQDGFFIGDSASWDLKNYSHQGLDMNIEELKLQYYHESLALAQRSLISGILISAVAYSIVISGEAKPNYLVPFFNIELSSIRTFSITLTALFFLFGLISSYATSKASKIWLEITDKQIANYIRNSPNIFFANTSVKSFLYAVLLTAGTGLAVKLLNIDGWKSIIAGSFLAAPYFWAMRVAVICRR